METALPSSRDTWIARGFSVLVHLLLLAFISIPAFESSSKSTVLLTVETVQGITPYGEGTGAEGSRPTINQDAPNANPLLNGMKLKMDESAAPLPDRKVSKAKPNPAAPPSLQDLEKEDEKMPLGLNPHSGEAAEQPSEGGMGNAKSAGAPDGLVGVSGQIGGRGFVRPDLNFPGNLPEEAELEIFVVVTPQGDVADARVEKSSGYPELNQFALSKAREFRFDPLTPAEVQENKTGILYFKFQYSGKGTVQ